MLEDKTFDDALSGEFFERIEAGDLDDFVSEAFADLPAPKIQQIVGGVFDDGRQTPTFDGTLTREQEDIILLFKRPSILIQAGTYEPPKSDTWNKILTENKAKFDSVISAVGRIEVDNHERLEWLGTGVVVETGIVMTNRHVAEHFLNMEGATPAFRVSTHGRKIRASIDLLEEHGDVIEENEHQLTDVLYVEPKNGPDLAFLKCPTAPSKIGFDRLSNEVAVGDLVAAIGYPHEDSRLRQTLKEAAQRIFGGIYGVKRLAPGKVGRVTEAELHYDCTTLNASSGSAVIAIETGNLVGLHSDGAITENIGVRAAVIRDRLETLRI